MSIDLKLVYLSLLSRTHLHRNIYAMKLPIQYKPTTVEDWTRSDSYHNSFLIPRDDAFEAANRNCEANDLPEIAVTAAQGKFLNLLARTMGAKRILEVGTLGGYVSMSFRNSQRCQCRNVN